MDGLIASGQLVVYVKAIMLHVLHSYLLLIQLTYTTHLKTGMQDSTTPSIIFKAASVMRFGC